MLPMETFGFHLSNTFQMFHKCICQLQCSKIDPDLEMFLRCSHSFLGTLAPSVMHGREYNHIFQIASYELYIRKPVR